MKNAINWFEIPVKDIERAMAFYAEILGAPVTVMPHPEMKYALLPYDQEAGGIGGGLVQMEGFEPTTQGTIVYLNGGDDLSGPLAKVEAAGGTIVMPKTSIGPNGFMAHFNDTEGNRIALHSMK